MRRMPTMVVILGVYFLVRNWKGDKLPLLAVGAIAVIGVVLYRAYQARAARQRATRVHQADVASLTEAVRSKLAQAANRILDVEGRPGLATSSEANEHFQKAVSVFVAVDEQLPAAVSTDELHVIVTDLDDALWRLDAAEAVLNGEEVPTRPGATLSRRPRSTALRAKSRDAVSRWSDDTGDRGHRRRRRSC